MKITISSLALLLLFSITSFAQSSYNVKGAVVDTAAKAKLLNATVMVLNAKDSILQKFTRSDAEGNFAINNLPKGKYLLVLSYPEYADYSEPFTLDSAHKARDFSKVNMLLKARILQDIIIKGEVTAIKIKGDTTEFNARAYTIQPNDKVEDLIRQFPGIQVDKDGKITANGQAVNKVLVDGEEFFGDDPTLVTKNIRADMVSKAQLYDKKSDQATFTGIDDGIKTKTLNIILKEDKKTGYFGKVDAGVGTQGFYQGQALYNNFKGKRKMSAYTTNGNTGKTGLSFQDAQKYGDSGVQVGEDGSLSISGGANDDGLDSFDGRYNNQGIPLARSGGVHYDTKWDSDKKSVNANYKIGSLEVDGTREGQNINNLTDSVLKNSNTQKFNNYIFRQKLDLTYQVKLDTTSNLKIAVDGTLKNNRTNNATSVVTRKGHDTQFYNPLDTLVNTNDRTTSNDGHQQLFNASVFYNKKLKKKGRTFSVLLGGTVNDNDNTGYVNSLIRYYDELGAFERDTTTDQYKTFASITRSFNSNITYTEPLTKTLSLSFNYGINVSSSNSDKKSFNKSASGKYDVLDPLYSNNFNLNQFAQQVGATFSYRKGKSTLNFGTRASDVTYNQIYFSNGQQINALKRHFINWMPQANYQLRMSQQSGLYINYSGYTNQPTIGQIQPIRDNTNPLNIVLGNDQLKPSFNNSFYINYNSYKVLSGQYLYFGGNFSFTANQIINSQTIKNGASITQSVNLTDRTPYNYGFYGTFGRKIKSIDLSTGLNLNVNGSKNYNYANGVLNEGRSNTISAGISANKYVQKKYNFDAGFGPNYTFSKTTPLDNGKGRIIENNGAGFYTRGSFNVFLPGKFQIGSDINYTYTAPTATFENDQRRTLWNANISRTFLKGNNLKLMASGNDLLNQNIGFSRNTNGNNISQNSNTTIRRYFMLSIIWDFSKMGGPTVPQK